MWRTRIKYWKACPRHVYERNQSKVWEPALLLTHMEKHIREGKHPRVPRHLKLRLPLPAPYAISSSLLEVTCSNLPGSNSFHRSTCVWICWFTTKLWINKTVVCRGQTPLIEARVLEYAEGTILSNSIANKLLIQLTRLEIQRGCKFTTNNKVIIIIISSSSNSSSSFINEIAFIGITARHLPVRRPVCFVPVEMLVVPWKDKRKKVEHCTPFAGMRQAPWDKRHGSMIVLPCLLYQRGAFYR